MNHQRRISIPYLLESHQARASQPAQQAIVDFACLYAKKLVAKCIEVGSLKGHLTEEDIKYVYETQKGIKSPVLEGELIDRKVKTIQAINKVALKELEPTFNEDPNNTAAPLSSFQTVRIGSQTYSGFPTGHNFQFCFQRQTN